MKKHEIAFCVLLVLTFAGCAHGKFKSIVGPDGTENEVITCDNMVVEKCYVRSREICGGNYKIINSNRFERDTQLLVRCDSGHAVAGAEIEKPGTSSSTSSTVSRNTVVYGPPSPPAGHASGDPLDESSNSLYPEAKTFADCEDLGPLAKGECRNAVYERAHPK